MNLPLLSLSVQFNSIKYIYIPLHPTSRYSNEFPAVSRPPLQPDSQGVFNDLGGLFSPHHKRESRCYLGGDYSDF